MAVGAAVGIACGWLLRQLRRFDLPGGRVSQVVPVLIAAFGAYELAVLLHGSGFLAVFLAGILIGGVENPHQQAIDRFHGVVAGLGEIVAFIVLGLTVDLRLLGGTDVLVPGLVLAVLLAVLIRPAAVGLCLSGVALARGERGFVLWSGLKGAVPLLLGSSLLTAAVPHPPRLYGVVVVVVAFSVLVQGGLLPYVADRLGLELHTPEGDG
jgi:cell volume regulation protein A